MPEAHELPIFRPHFGGRRPTSGGGGSLRNAVLSIARARGWVGRITKAASQRPPRSRIAVLPPGASARRVVVKVHLVKLTATGAKAARLHLRYIERDGVERDGGRGILYGAEGPIPRESFEEPRPGERHQFRLVVSPEDAAELDLTDYVRRYMARVEKDLGRRIEWAAVNHHNTEHPHAHVVLRGVDRDGRELRLDRGYVSHGLRHRAQELATDELGPRPQRDIERAHQREVTQERFTSLDRDLERCARDSRIDIASLQGRPPSKRSVLVARLRHLEDLGLAHRPSADAWILTQGWQQQLRDLGARGDIVKQIHSAISGDPSRYRIVRAGEALSGDPESSPVITGRVAAKGLTDELKGAFYAVIETPDGQAYHVPVNTRAADSLKVGSVVSVTTRPESPVRPLDHPIAERAGKTGGIYEVAAEPSGAISPEERRLRELERLGLVRREGTRAWRVPPDLCQRLEARSSGSAPRHRLFLQEQPLDLPAQIRHPGPVWLDRLRAQELAPYGFGAELRRMLERRQEAVRKFGIRPDDPDRIEKLRAMETGAMGKKIAERTGQRFVDVPPAGFRGRVQVLEGKPGASAHAVVSDGSRFVLVGMSSSVRALEGRTVTVSRDPKGQLVVRGAHERDRGS